MKKKLKKIGILCFWKFPDGMAPTVRILAYSKGLVANGVKVEIVSFARIFKDEAIKNEIKKSGVIGGIQYTYPHLFLTQSKNQKILRGIDEIILRLKTYLYFLKSHLKERYDIIFLSFDDQHSLKTYTNLNKLINVPLALLADEYPIPIRDFNKAEIPADYVAEYKKRHKKISLRILMTKNLQEFYNEKISVKPTFIMSNITELKRFNGIVKQNVERKYFCYMGNMGLDKDNVDNIIKSFSLIANKFTNIDLHLYGTPNERDKSFLESLIIEKKLSNRVFIKGRIGFNEVPQVLTNAIILLTSQPLTKRAEGGFPTKLGEYLLSGVPSILTNVGEIYKYILDGENAYLVEPCNPQQYADKIEFILNNYDDALKVGQNGKKYIIDNFGNINVAKKLISFLEEELLNK